MSFRYEPPPHNEAHSSTSVRVGRTDIYLSYLSEHTFDWEATGATSKARRSDRVGVSWY